MTYWLTHYHGLPESAREIVEANLRTQFKWHRLQGRLDQPRFGALKILAKLLGLRQSVKQLARREPKSVTG